MIPVIMSGGSGTRLWPLSREMYPKQFCDIMEESLMLKTINRLKPLGSCRVITTEKLKVLTEKSLAQVDIPIENAIYEPEGRNTAPAVALICKKLLLEGKGEEVVGIFPADHVIENEEEFRKSISLASKVAEKDLIVTLGIKPSFAATGFGYIETKAEEAGRLEYLKCYKTEAFHEKPKEEIAQDYVKKGNFFWNAGIFIFKVNHMAALFKEHASDIWSDIDKLEADLKNLSQIYGEVRKESIDYAIMENTKDIGCVPCDIGWSDLGSWDEVANHYDQRLGSGGVEVNLSSKNNFVFSSTSKAVALVGVEDLIVVDTGDTLLVCKKGESQKVKEVVTSLKDIHYSSKEHLFEHRPWGKYTVLHDAPEFKVKRIVINPGQALSYQLHERRSEHWVVIGGQGTVVLNDEEHELKVGDSIEIPKNSKHRMRNDTSIDLEFVEVQTGDYFGEDDIQRFVDQYGRV